MQLLQYKSGLRLWCKTALAGVFSLLLATIGFLSVNNELHQRFCSGADTQDHECAVTLFSHGQVDSLSGVAMVAHLIACLTQTISPAIEPELVSVDFLLLPGRAPPVGCA